MMRGRRHLRKAAWLWATIVVFVFFIPILASAYAPIRRGFMPNKGQLYDQQGKSNTAVRYALFTHGLNVQVNADGFSYDFWSSDSSATRYHRVEVVLHGARLPLDWRALNRLAGVFNVVDPYTPLKTHTVEHFERLYVKDVYPHIDLELVATESGMKYNFIVHPDGEMKDIVLDVAGAPAAIKDGTIAMQTIFGVVEEKVPYSFCQENGHEIDVQFFEKAPGRFGLEMNEKDTPLIAHQTLVIDPVPNRLWGSYWGGTSLEFVYGLTEDNLGNVYVCGVGTGSLSFTTSGAYQTVMAGLANDAFIFKFNSTGIIQWCTYYGGNNGETARAIAASGAGDLYVVGFTDSTSGIASTGAFRTTLAGGSDAFLVRFSAAGAYVWGTYIGGTSEDYLRAVHYDAAADVVIVGGHTKSASQASAGAHQTAHAGAGDGYVASFSPIGARNWATYCGGSGEDIVNGVHLNGAGNILIGGSTASLTGIATPGVHQTASGGANDGFMAVFSLTGVRSWGTYFGGSGTDLIKAVKIAYNGALVGVGETSSTNAIASAAAHQTVAGGGNDAMVAVLNASGTLAWSSYYGGAANDAANAVAIDTTNNVYLIGNTVSATAIATANAYQTTIAGGLDGFLAQFTQSGLRNWGTYYGGPGSETVNGGVVNLALQLHIAGHSTSTSGITTPGTSQVNHTPGINDDPFVVKFGELVLPIELGEVKTLCNDGEWGIHWQTVSESNTDYFEVYLGDDLLQWQLCERLPAKGSSVQVQDYAIDGRCLPLAPKYFQIVLVNTNGSREVVYTGAMDCTMFNDWGVGPNPTDGLLRLFGHSAQWMVYDAFGRLMLQSSSGFDSQIVAIDTSNWFNGVYFVRAGMGGNRRTERIVVQHH